jgi:hypothetical protein
MCRRPKFLERDRAAVLTLRAAVQGVVDYRKADPHNPIWWKHWRYLVKAMDEKAHETLLHHALEFQLALVSNSRISSDDFTKVQREAKELFGDIEGSLRPWLGRTKQDRQTRDVEDFRAMWKEAAGFDLDDVEAREAWEDQVRGLVNDSTVKREAREHEEQEKERKFAATIEAIRQKRLRQQGRK